MNNSQLAHVWAQQTRAKMTGSNMYFEGAVIYSYGPHYPIARFTDKTHKGNRVVLFNYNGSTMTTESKHKPKVREALRGLPVTVFYVDDVNAGTLGHGMAHDDNLRRMADQFDALVSKAARASKNSDSYIEDAQALACVAAAYAEVFNQVIARDMTCPESKQEATVLSKEAQARKDAAKKIADEKRAIELKAKAKKDAATARKDAKKWRANEAGVSYLMRALPVMLRLSANRERIETSRGAHITASLAPMVWRAVTTCKNRKEAHAYSRDELSGNFTPIMGHFTLDSISAKGDIVAGCHEIAFKELELIANQLELIS